MANIDWKEMFKHDCEYSDTSQTIQLNHVAEWVVYFASDHAYGESACD